MTKAKWIKSPDTLFTIDEVLRLGIASINCGCNDLKVFLIAIKQEHDELDKAIDADFRSQYGDKI